MAFRLFLITGCVLLAACSSPQEMEQKIAQQSKSVAVAQAKTNGASDLKVETDRMTFGYSYPREAGAIAPLAATLDADAKAIQSELDKTTAAEQAEASKGGFDYRPHSYEMTWKVVTDTPQFLSLSGEFSTYSGGAHGMYGVRSLVWDKRAGRSLDGAALFASPAALDQALGTKLCDALNAERVKRRGAPLEDGGVEEFSRCISTAEATVLVGSSTGTAFDRIGIWFGPYVAGSYAEGAYELDFPVDGAVMRAVKPVYRTAFTPAG